MVVWEDDEDIYYNCPSEFIPDNVNEWWGQYCYEKEFGTTINYGERSIKYIKALLLYRYWLKEYTPKRLTQDGFAKVRQVWQKKS